MMGTLTMMLAGKMILTPEERYWADIKGDIENINNVLKITTMRVTCLLKLPLEKNDDVRDAFPGCITHCTAAQRVIGCSDIRDISILEEVPE